MQKQLLDSKVVRAGELDDCHIGDRKLIKHGLELPILVLPKHNAAFIELRQGGRKSLVQIQCDSFISHIVLHLLPVLPQ